MLKDAIAERYSSILRGLRKYKPVNGSKGRRYLEPYYDPLPPDILSPLRSRSPTKQCSRPHSITPRPATTQRRQRRPLFIAGSKASLGGKVDRVGALLDVSTIAAPPEDASSPPLRISIGRTDQRSHRACSYCDSPEALGRLSTAKSPSHDVRSRLTEFIAKCDRPKTVSSGERRLSLKLSVSFSDLQECVQLTKDNTGRGEMALGSGISQTIKHLRRQRREEARNVEDKATLQLFADQKREVSNYIITKFRRIRMWKHCGIVVPRKLEDSMYQYWTKANAK